MDTLTTKKTPSNNITIMFRTYRRAVPYRLYLCTQVFSCSMFVKCLVVICMRSNDGLAGRTGQFSTFLYDTVTTAWCTSTLSSCSHYIHISCSTGCIKASFVRYLHHAMIRCNIYFDSVQHICRVPVVRTAN